LAEKNSNTHLTLQEEVTTSLLSNKFEEEVVKIVVKIDLKSQKLTKKIEVPGILSSRVGLQ
jgi:hypothetical protein